MWPVARPHLHRQVKGHKRSVVCQVTTTRDTEHAILPMQLADAHGAGRAPVPQRDDAVGVALVLVGARVLAREPKVGQLQDAAVVDQQVAGLEVAVQHVAAVAVRQAGQQLAHVALDLSRACGRSGRRRGRRRGRASERRGCWAKK